MTLKQQCVPKLDVSPVTSVVEDINNNLQGQLGGKGITGVLTIQINDFRRINVSYGYAYGERLMAAVYHRLQEGLPKRDKVYWLGRGEFVVVLTNLRIPQNLMRAIDKVRDLLYPPFSTGTSKLKVRFTMGATTSLGRRLKASMLLNEADQAMLKAEQSVLEYAVFDEALIVEQGKELEIQSNLEMGLEKGEFSLVYQPKVEFQTSRIVGVEALMRWNSSELGVIRPDHFIIAAEQTGFIGPLTEWAIRTAVKQYSTWGDLRVPVAVNLSAGVLSDPHLLDLIDRALEIWSVPKSALSLEITETAMMDRPEQCIGVMRQLRDHGLRLSIDDFGTGYSSLAYLKDLPVDELKIDKSFVDNLLTDKGDQKIVAAVTSLASNFGLKTVAEGIEDSDTFEYLRKLGCVVAQGYYISRPLPPEEFPTWSVLWGRKAKDQAKARIQKLRQS